MSERMYTLAEAQAELRRLQCREEGHDPQFGPRKVYEQMPTVVFCRTCGWHGTVTWDERQP